MQIDKIEEKLESIVTDIIGANYPLDSFVSHILENRSENTLGEYLKTETLKDLEAKITAFLEDTANPEPWDGAARMTEDILKTVDVVKYPVFK
jgi:hypothetical protein